MRINLWHTKDLDEWRWSLTSKTYGADGTYQQETGSRKDLREAMGDIANTVEYLIEKKADGKDQD
tara:strand:- start:677 stop:871 length:195 start_codon:yes stop_codon:yes gene_type:complete